MDSFFSRVKSFFHQDFDGRYLGIIISNGFEEAPEPFLKFFKKHTTCRINLNAKSKYKLLCEFSFGSDNSKADLALFESGTSRPILVIELKFLDKFHKGKSTSAKLSQWDS